MQMVLEKNLYISSLSGVKYSIIIFMYIIHKKIYENYTVKYKQANFRQLEISRSFYGVFYKFVNVELNTRSNYFFTHLQTYHSFYILYLHKIHNLIYLGSKGTFFIIIHHFIYIFNHAP